MCVYVYVCVCLRMRVCVFNVSGSLRVWLFVCVEHLICVCVAFVRTIMYEYI